jgi:acyl-CoA oxidase
MAMKYAQVDKEGNYTVTSAPKKREASYSTMTLVRGFIVANAGFSLSMACTIAVRYSAVRRQGFVERSGTTGEENQVLDYAIQQHRILPILATSFAFKVSRLQCSDYPIRLLTSVLHFPRLDPVHKFTGTAMQSMAKSGNNAALHLASSGLKSLCSKITATGIEECRKACGGHGYLQTSGLPELLGTYLQNCTVEGENYMIAQQTTRQLLKIMGTGHGADGDASYLLDIHKSAGVRCSACSVEDFCSADALLVEAYRLRASYVLKKLQVRLAESVEAGMSDDEAWNAAGMLVIKASDAHCFLVLVSNFSTAVANLATSREEGVPAVAAALRNCFHLFALYWIAEAPLEFMAGGYMDAEQAEIVSEAVRHLLSVVRHDAVPLVDGWGHSDHLLNSVLGRYDGDVYRALLMSTRPELNPMNATKVHEAYSESILPLMQGLNAKL